jgi:hypothetical protein
MEKRHAGGEEDVDPRPERDVVFLPRGRGDRVLMRQLE